ncbi:aspartate-semialdehyde dehydrogenase [Rhodohalobacter mucosus]|uniref:Aspartate-semialdehyde dehydrogenase n=1 Tax=Rhodohalobacter mucosus TaxID=2079485 RepID=A0A316TL61_9BACT|nr:aspartate-semialdehyde dehydrogenase [Rhodohalobacter mucosus]PWN05303.1 aspartate-semialdehyde dehydrogenase [Rhodohalobacter mucosus]
MSKFNAGILGATGAVGQKFIRLLQNHPWFTITALGASERSAGKTYREAANWIEAVPMPDTVAGLSVRNCVSGEFDDVDFVFSGLDSSVATDIEKDFASAGIPVISNAKNYRTDPTVPLLIPEVNPDHIELIKKQKFTADGSGWIVTNPNCVVVPLVTSLKPLYDAFGIDAVVVTSMQAISGAGYPGVASLDILGNVVPYIGGEESKVESEPHKLLGKLNEEGILNASFPIQSTATRVPVENGHMLAVTVGLKNKASASDVIDAMKNWQSPIADLGLPSAPPFPIKIHEDERYPQPRLHADSENGMQTAVGRIRETRVLDISYIAMAHNTVRGAAGGAILNAELLVKKGYL